MIHNRVPTALTAGVKHAARYEVAHFIHVNNEPAYEPT